MFNQDNSDDVTDLWDTRLERSCSGTFYQPEKVVPRLESWFAISQGSQTVLSGIIYNHPKLKDGRRISTSTVQDYQTDESGKLYLVTRNSRYELGKQLVAEGMEPSFGKETMHVNQKD
jgi:hypothetical protein